MRQGFYRTILAFCAAYTIFVLPTLAISIHWAILKTGNLPLDGISIFFGFALLPIAAIGLWNWRNWGFIALIVGVPFVVVPVSVHEGIGTGLGWAFLHFACVVATILRCRFGEVKAAQFIR